MQAGIIRIAQDNFFPLEMQVQQENIEAALRWEWEQKFDAEGTPEADRKPFWKIFREKIIEPYKMVPEATAANEPTVRFPFLFRS